MLNCVLVNRAVPGGCERALALKLSKATWRRNCKPSSGGRVRETVSLERIKMGQFICVGQECNQTAYVGPTQSVYLVQGKTDGFSGSYL